MVSTIRRKSGYQRREQTMLRQHGFNGIGVADMMNAAGLTHGGFYRNFTRPEFGMPSRRYEMPGRQLTVIRPAATNLVSSALKADGFSICGVCPQSSKSAIVALGVKAAAATESLAGRTTSCFP